MPIYKMVGKKDGLQKYRVRINYTDRDGKAHQLDRVAYGSAEAKDLETRLLKEVQEKNLPAKMTLQELFNEYIYHKKHEVRESSLDKTIQILNRSVLNVLGGYKIDKLNISVLQKWKSGIAEKGKSLQTNKNIYGEFRTLLNYAVKMEYLPKNPLSCVGNFKDAYNFEKPQDKLKYYTPSQFLQYIAVAYRSAQSLTDWGYYVFFNIAFYTGMRKGEINALKWTDIDGNILHVRRSVAQKLKGKSIVETPPKNKSSYRDLQIPKPLLDILNEHKKRQMADKNFTDDFRICGGIKCLGDTALSNKNICFAKEAGLPRIRIHDFRHSHASVLVNEGINIQEIARRLGHSKIEITWNTYAHLYPREEERAVKILDNIVYKSCIGNKKSAN